MFYEAEQAKIILNKLKEIDNKPSKKSKWAKIADDIEALKISKATWEHINSCREEFRVNQGA